MTREIHLTADPALLLEPEDFPLDALRAEGVEFDRPLVGFSVREPGPAAPDIDPEEYHALLANAADFIVERYDADVVFPDGEGRRAAQPRRRRAHAKLRAGRDPAAALLATSDPASHRRFEFAVGMRLHFLIFAALAATPFAALPYASKVTGLLEHLEIETPPLGSIGIGQLIGRIDRSWDRRQEIRARIRERLPDLKARARRTNELLMEVVRRESGSVVEHAAAGHH